MNPGLQAALAAAAAEFSDIAGPGQAVRLMLRLSLAAGLGFALGYQRELSGKAAGARTHMLVAIGSALFVLIAQETGITASDMSRVIQGLIAGIGFLCAGTIFRHGAGPHSVHGLTTAAGLWMTAAIGLACGLGRGLTAVLSALCALAILAAVPHFSNNNDKVGSKPDEPPPG